MTQRLRITHLSHISNQRLEQIWTEDPVSLVTTAVADAEGRVREETAQLLRGAWFSRWYDAVCEAEAELSSSYEKMVFTRDPRVKDTRVRMRQVRTRYHEAHVLYRRRTSEVHRKHWSSGPQQRMSITVGSWLSLLHPEEAEAARAEQSQRLGIPKPAWLQQRATGRADFLRRCAEHGLLDAPMTEEVARLTRLDDESFRNLVADDASDKVSRVGELRHPAMLNDWMAALHQLMDMNVENAWANADSDELPPVDFKKLATLGQESGRQVLNTRRFYRALLQRRLEWKVVMFDTGQLADAARLDAERPWNQVVDAASNVLIRRYPEEAQVMFAALEPYLEPNSRLWLDAEALNAQQRFELRQKVFADLGHAPAEAKD